MREDINNNEQQRSQSNNQRRSSGSGHYRGDDYQYDQYSQGGNNQGTSEYRRGSSGQGDDARQNWDYDTREYSPNRHSQDSWSNAWQRGGRQFEQEGHYNNQYGLNQNPNQQYPSDRTSFPQQGHAPFNESYRSSGQHYNRGEQNNESNQHAHRFDPDYHQWREEQVRKLDSDYHSWREERYKKFADEFNEWRETRSKQSADNKNSAQSSSLHANTDSSTSNKNK
ncbi:MAG: hypothetical protein V4525_12460 [Pseudomonadota bacterium]